MAEVDLWQKMWVAQPVSESKNYHVDPVCERLTLNREPDAKGRRRIKAIKLGSALASGRTECAYCFK